MTLPNYLEPMHMRECLDLTATNNQKSVLSVKPV